MTIVEKVSAAVKTAVDAGYSVGVLFRAGLVPAARPDEVVRSMLDVRRLGAIAGAFQVAARRHPNTPGIVDELGTLTFGEIDRRATGLATAFAHRGITADSMIAVLCRDHRGELEAMIAAGKLGASVVLMNTGFAGTQLGDVSAREGVSAVVFDQEFTALAAALPPEVDRYLAWVDDRAAIDGGVPTLEELITATPQTRLANPPHAGHLVMLTSGTTGTPKGAPRRVSSPLAAAQFLDRIPYRSDGATFLAAPAFHGTGLSQLILTVSLGSAVVLRRRFDAEAVLRGIQDNRCTAVVMVPTMLQRVLDLGPDVLARYDTSTLRIVFVAGSALSPELGNRATAAFGEVLYNLYGSTEVAVATVATPADWKAAPGTVGRIPVGCHVNLYDEHDRRITRAHQRGRIFVGSGLAFEGYTGGAHKEIIDGLLSSGDAGYFDEAGRLFIDGRSDDMVISGGENVFPAEIENLLVTRGDVRDAAVLGVVDADFGQRLKAFVVPEPGTKPDADALRAYVKDNLARYKVPKDVVFLDELPRNATGKVLRTRLLEHGDATEGAAGPSKSRG